MAVEYIAAVYELPDLSASEVAILAYLANKANARGDCWPSRATIAAKVRLHPDTVKATMQQLAHPDRPGGALLAKEARYSEGRRVPNRIVLLFQPVDLSSRRGDTPPTRGGIDPPTPGDAETPREGGSSTPGKNLQIEPSSSTRETASLLWALASKAGRRKSGKADVDKALMAALVRGAEVERLKEAVVAYYAVPRHIEEDGRWAMGLHRLIEQDRWREWAPDLEDCGVDSEPRARAAPPPVDEATMAAHMDRVWRSRLEDLRTINLWVPKWGPKPGQPGCQVPEHLLADAGVGA